MSQILTSNRLIESVKRRAMIPRSQSTFDEADFLDILNEEVSLSMMPHVLQLHEEYLVYYEEIDLVTTKRRYPIPTRSVGNKLRDAAFVDSSGKVYELSRVSLGDISDFQGDFTIQRRDVFYVENNEIVFPNQVSSSSGKIRMYFYLRPNSLVAENRAGIISGIDRASGTITLSQYPAIFNNQPLFDFVQSRSPNKIYSYGITSTSVNQTLKTVTFDSGDIPEDLVVGDYIMFEQETIVPNIPTELHPLLCQYAAVRCLEALGDQEGLAAASTKLQQMETNTMKLIDDRVEGAPRKILNRNSQLKDAVRGRKNSLRWG
jgi:hypothetical protein